MAELPNKTAINSVVHPWQPIRQSGSRQELAWLDMQKIIKEGIRIKKLHIYL